MLIRKIADRIHRILPGALTLMAFTIMGASFLWYSTGLLVVIGVALLFYAYENYSEQFFATKIWIGSLIFFGIVMSWLLETSPQSWTELRGPSADMAVFVVWISVVLILSLGFLFHAWSYSRICSALSLSTSHLKLPLFVSIWIISEFGRSYVFSLFMYSTNATLGSHWNFGNLGLGLTTTPLVDLASTVGMYGLSAYAVLLGYSIYAGLKSPSSTKGVFVVLFALVLPFCADHLIDKTTHQPTRKISVAALNTDANEITDKDYIDLASKARGNAELLVLPEYSGIFEDPEKDRLQSQFLSSVAKTSSFDTSKLVIVTSRENEKDEFSRTNELVHFRQDGSVLSTQNKSFLIPGGEYLPVLARIIITSIDRSLVDSHLATREITKAKKTEEPVPFDSISIGSLACSGVISPHIYREISSKGAQILTNSASLNVFSNAQHYHEQTKAFARFHAVANDKPFIQATKGGEGLIISGDGEIVANTKVDTELLQAEVESTDSRTLFLQLGEVTLPISFAFIPLTLIIPPASDRKRQRE